MCSAKATHASPNPLEVLFALRRGPLGAAHHLATQSPRTESSSIRRGPLGAPYITHEVHITFREAEHIVHYSPQKGLSQKGKFCGSPLFKNRKLVKKQKSSEIKGYQRTAKRSREKTAFFFSKKLWESGIMQHPPGTKKFRNARNLSCCRVFLC